MPQGGWFTIAIDDANATFQLQAPQVTPTAAGMKGPRPVPRTAPRRDEARAALAAYVEITRRHR